jgi:AraC-like DNA-binding protein
MLRALIEKAKQLLLSTSLTVNETAFRLGFDYPHYFTRWVKGKTGLTPVSFRASAAAGAEVRQQPPVRKCWLPACARVALSQFKIIPFS